MKISTKGRYGLKALIDLAINVDSENVTIKSICERQNISERYLEQIFSSLRKGGVIIGRKGSQGGYYFSKAISEFTIGEILRILEGDLEVIDTSNNEDAIDEVESFINENLWSILNHKINSFFDGITLEQLVNDFKASKDSLTYYI